MSFEIAVEWEELESGSPEERACAALLTIFVHDRILTEIEDRTTRQTRDGVHVSAYPLAEWFAWHWWRLCWEPRTEMSLDDPEWLIAHNLRSVGEGYVWPDLTFASDGARMLVAARSTPKRPAEPIRYLTDFVGAIPVETFQRAVEQFMEKVLSRLRERQLSQPDLAKIWGDVQTEREDADAKRYRAYEALLGFDPDEAPDKLVERLIGEGEAIGQDSIVELAALSGGRGDVPTVQSLREAAGTLGYKGNFKNMVRLDAASVLSPYHQAPAWQRGVEAARALRQQEKLNEEPIADSQLAEMLGVPVSALSDGKIGYEFAFVLAETSDSFSLVQRSKWQTGRRFDLARLLADRLAVVDGGCLLPATTTHTYRQKLQKAFAAEFLCPIAAADRVADGDYSEESQQTIAEMFDVSLMMVNSLLKNNGRIPKGHLVDATYDADAA